LAGTIAAVDAEQVITSPDLVSVNRRVPADDQVAEADAADLLPAVTDTAAAAATAQAARITLGRFIAAGRGSLKFEHLLRVRGLLPLSAPPLSAHCHPGAGRRPAR
jgi:hypothetical protein